MKLKQNYANPDVPLVDLEEIQRRTRHHLAGVRDSKGRECGAVTVVKEYRVLNPTRTHCGYRFEGTLPETIYGASVTATRDRQPYGASQPDQFFTTLEECHAYFAKRVAGTFMRQWKQFDAENAPQRFHLCPTQMVF